MTLFAAPTVQVPINSTQISSSNPNFSFIVNPPKISNVTPASVSVTPYPYGAPSEYSPLSFVVSPSNASVGFWVSFQYGVYVGRYIICTTQFGLTNDQGSWEFYGEQQNSCSQTVPGYSANVSRKLTTTPPYGELVFTLSATQDKKDAKTKP